MKHRALFFISSILITNSLFAESKSLWPQGEDVCTGPWEIEKYKSCKYGVDYNNPITEISGYEKKPASCRHFTHGYTIKETKDIVVTSGSFNSNGHIRPQKYCENNSVISQLPRHQTGVQRWVSVGIQNATISRNCESRNHITKNCQTYSYEHQHTCTFELQEANEKANAQACGLEDDNTKPINIVVGFNDLFGSDVSCGSEFTTTEPGKSLHDLGLSEALKQKAVCLTGDGINLDSEGGLSNKLSLLRKELIVQMGNEIDCKYSTKLHTYAENLLNEKSDDINPSQKRVYNMLLTKIADKCL
ncbi:MAG: hypothetical protein ACOH5I_25355 [Oligoflexus sp.]